jgi:hypothetical protein
VQAEQAARAEHGQEPEQEWRRRHTGDVEAQVQRAQQAAEDVVDDQGQQQETASQQQADSENQVGGAQGRTTSDCILGRGTGYRSRG